IAQYLQLVHAADHPDVLDQNTLAALKKFEAAGLIAQDVSETLIPAARLYHNLTQILRLCVEGPFSAAEASEGLKLLLVQAGGEPDFRRLEHRLADCLSSVWRIYVELIASRAACPAAENPDN
ncbi:MAG: bifunctional [glutamine synthetase] adenylyltransferase/[glutamine synthetase]-adenylyl-L-tyrosine phosphorylase, partial [Methyloligellaceae bacterium]